MDPGLTCTNKVILAAGSTLRGREDSGFISAGFEDVQEQEAKMPLVAIFSVSKARPAEILSMLVCCYVIPGNIAEGDSLALRSYLDALAWNLR